MALAAALIGLVAVALVLESGSDRLKRLIPWKAEDSNMALTGLVSTREPLPQGRTPVVQAGPGFPKEASSRSRVTIAQNSPVPSGAHEDSIAFHENLYTVIARSEATKQSQQGSQTTPRDYFANARNDNFLMKHYTGLEAAHEASPEVSSQANNFPGVLGQVTAKYGDTVLEMICKLYGASVPHHLSQILASVVRLNPEIKDIDEIYVGDVINFPAVPVPDNPLPPAGWWVQLATKDTLEEAYEFTRLYADSALPLRMLPYWNSREGMKFAVLVRHCFVDERSARSIVDTLPAMVSPGARILTGWDEDTLFFSTVPTTQLLDHLTNQLSKEDKN